MTMKYCSLDKSSLVLGQVVLSALKVRFAETKANMTKRTPESSLRKRPVTEARRRKNNDNSGPLASLKETAAEPSVTQLPCHSGLCSPHCAECHTRKKAACCARVCLHRTWCAAQAASRVVLNVGYILRLWSCGRSQCSRKHSASQPKGRPLAHRTCCSVSHWAPCKQGPEQVALSMPHLSVRTTSLGVTHQCASRELCPIGLHTSTLEVETDSCVEVHTALTDVHRHHCASTWCHRVRSRWYTAALSGRITESPPLVLTTRLIRVKQSWLPHCGMRGGVR